MGTENEKQGIRLDPQPQRKVQKGNYGTVGTLPFWRATEKLKNKGKSDIQLCKTQNEKVEIAKTLAGYWTEGKKSLPVGPENEVSQNGKIPDEGRAYANASEKPPAMVQGKETGKNVTKAAGRRKGRSLRKKQKKTQTALKKRGRRSPLLKVVSSAEKNVSLIQKGGSFPGKCATKRKKTEIRREDGKIDFGEPATGKNGFEKQKTGN